MIRRFLVSVRSLQGLVMTGLLVTVLGTGSTDAQGNRNSQSRLPSTGGFAQQAPGIGQPLPELTLYTAEGKEFSTSQLKGSYTVLVFGCLT